MFLLQQASATVYQRWLERPYLTHIHHILSNGQLRVVSLRDFCEQGMNHVCELFAFRAH